MASSEVKIVYVLAETNRNGVGLVRTKDVQFQCIRRSLLAFLFAQREMVQEGVQFTGC